MSRRMFAVVALVLALLPLVAPAPLIDPDDGLHAAIAQEMAHDGDYITPTFLGEPFFDKPILFFWTEAASLRVFGMHERAVRLPSVVFGLLGMIGVALLGRAMFDESTGLIAGAAYGTMYLPVAMSTLAVNDVGLPPMLCVAALQFWKSSVGSGSVTAGSASRSITTDGIVAGISLGLSILTKGLVGVVFAGMFAACVAAIRPASLARVLVAFTIALGVEAVLAAPWYVAMERAHPGYLYYYFVERHLRGYLTATQRHALRPWWYYLPVLAAGALPWTGYVFVSASKLFRRSMREVNQPLLVTCGWVGLGLIFLGIGESKLVTYALPVVPGLALAAAAAWKGDIRESAGGRAAFLVQTVAMTGLPVLACVAIESQLGSVTTALWSAAALVTFVVAGIAVAAWIAPTAPRRLARTLIANIVSIGFVLGIAAPYAARWLTGRDLATALNAAGTLPPRVSIYGERIGSVVFYLSPQLRAQATADRIVETTLPTAVPRVAVDPPDAVLAIREQYANRLTRLFKRPVEPDLRAGTFLIYRNDTLRRALR